MRGLAIAMALLFGIGCSRQVPDLPAVGASAPDGRKARQPQAPAGYRVAGDEADAGVGAQDDEADAGAQAPGEEADGGSPGASEVAPVAPAAAPADTLPGAEERAPSARSSDH